MTVSITGHIPCPQRINNKQLKFGGKKITWSSGLLLWINNNLGNEDSKMGYFVPSQSYELFLV